MGLAIQQCGRARVSLSLSLSLSLSPLIFNGAAVVVVIVGSLPAQSVRQKEAKREERGSGATT